MLFVSIHCNSSEDGSGKGIETYYTEQKGTSSESLANEIQNAVIEHTSAENREVKTANYTVFRQTAISRTVSARLVNHRRCRVCDVVKFKEIQLVVQIERFLCHHKCAWVSKLTVSVGRWAGNHVDVRG